jgi:hypothetical protein
MASNRVPPPPAPLAQAQGAPAPKPAAPPAAPAAVAPTEQQVKARPVQRTAPTADAVFPAAAPLSSEEATRWITRIVELRRAGRDAEADAELKALRERAPTLTLPPEALPRAGTR